VEEEEEDLVDPATHIKENCATAHCSAVRAKLGKIYPYFRYLISEKIKSGRIK
jgi:hypothetical protein